MEPVCNEEKLDNNSEDFRSEEHNSKAPEKQPKTHTDLESAHHARSLAISFRCQLLSKKSFHSRPTFKK